MTATDDLYAFVVELETYEASGWPEVGHTREQWNAEVHRRLEVRAAVHYDRLGEHDPQDLLLAFTWAAGYLARLRLKLHDAIKRHAATVGHERCKTCGFSYSEGIAGTYPREGPRLAVTEGPPMLGCNVPAEYAEGWAETIRRLLAHMVADETTRWPSPAPVLADAHQPPTLTTQANDETTRSMPQ